MANLHGLPKQINGPVENGYAVTPSDSVDLTFTNTDGNTVTFTTRGIYLGASGDLKVDLERGGTVTFTGLSAGVIHPVAAKRIYATGTTATSILGLF